MIVVLRRTSFIFTGFTQEMLDFMLDIRFNNNKTFMAENRNDYIRVMRAPYYALIDHLAPTMLEINANMEVRPNKCLSRIFRDARFSKDKSPCRDHHWVAFRQAGIPRESAPMYWMEVRVEKVSWGLGFWGENKKAMEHMRRRMVAKPKEFSALNALLKKNDFALAGEDYKRLKVPDDLNPAVADWYPKKELLFVKEKIDPAIIFTPAFADTLAEDFKALAPVYHLMQGSYELALNEGEIS